ncbi:hypothetical protein VU08_08990, partial [Desulfobulbus sp. F5]|nr:hypothetical protein [Desulfobulbus sp. F5]
MNKLTTGLIASILFTFMAFSSASAGRDDRYEHHERHDYRNDRHDNPYSSSVYIHRNNSRYRDRDRH